MAADKDFPRAVGSPGGPARGEAASSQGGETSGAQELAAWQEKRLADGNLRFRDDRILIRQETSGKAKLGRLAFGLASIHESDVHGALHATNC